MELLANGSGFVRVEPPDPSDDDVYISSAQVKRCELVSGDRIAGPKRAPRRSERFASLIRIETINGRPAAELADSVRFDDLPAAFPTERLKVGSDDPTLKAIEWLTPFGKGSRVTIVGGTRAGKTEALRRLVTAFADQKELTVSLVLAGVRPEEISEWNGGPVPPTAAVSFAGSEEARNGAVEPAIDQARRLAARGSDAVVFVDTLDGCSPHLARKALGAARNIVDGGSVTIIATASAPIGGETTVITLDAALAGAGRFPALDLGASGTMRPELLVGEAGAEAIARTRAEADGLKGARRALRGRADEQPAPHLLLALRVQVPQPLEPRAQVGGEPIHAVVIDLHQVAGRVADVHLHDVAGQLDEMIAERVVVKRVAPLGRAIGRLEVGDGDPEVMVAGGERSRSNRCSCVSPSASHCTGMPKLGVGMGSAPSRST